MSRSLPLLLFISLTAVVLAAPKATPSFKLAESLDIARVPADFPVGFCLLTHGGRQYVAYFDEERRMTVASRLVDAAEWTYQVLPSKVGWDSHNYITMAVDDDGQLHVSGNMHCVPLIYFRTREPGDIATLEEAPMVGKQEKRVTYPKFLTDHEGTLIFNYRDGGSGKGKRLWNRYDPESRRWSRLLDVPVLDGEGQRNAYPTGPVRGPDGWFHMIWVWRHTPDCATNHHLSYARSPDLKRWESAFGKSVKLPIVIGEESLLVDPIPSGGGIINGGAKLSFDSGGRPLITYHKSDAEGHMQIYAARPENGKWHRRQLTDWNEPIKFSGNGSMGFIGIRVTALSQVDEGLFTVSFRHRDHGGGRLFVDEKTLRPVARRVSVGRTIPRELDRLESDFKGMGIHREEDHGDSGDPSVRYILQWETLGANRDGPRKPPLPGPSMLRLHKLTLKP
jgi:hypothetical protein